MKKRLMTVFAGLALSHGLQAQVTLIDPAGDGGFETGTTFAANSWSVAQGTATNRVWYVGTAQAGYSGAREAHIGNSATNLGSNNATRVVHLYRSVTIPGGATNIVLSFKYKQPLADNNYDFLQVFMNGNTPANGTAQTAGLIGTIDPVLDADYANFTTVTYTLSNTLAGATNNLIFTFNSDNVTPIGQGAIDDVSLTYILPSCPAPSGLVINGITSSSVNATWTSNGSETAWDLYYGPTPLTAPSGATVPTATASAMSHPISGLSATTGYAFYVRAHCSVSDQSTWSGPFSFITPCSPPPVSSTTGDSRCGIGTMTLGATSTAGATLNWYTAPTGGNAVATGSVYTTPTISTTTNYYVSASGGSSIFFAGIPAASGSLSYGPLGDGLRFNATQSFTLNSVDVYSNDASSAIITIELQNSGGSVLNSYTMTIPPGTGTTPVTVPVNFAIAPGNGYYLVAADGPDIILDGNGATYPYAIGTVGSITSGYDGLFGSNSSTEYFYFYNWQISTPCESPRSMVTATVTAPLPLTVNTATAVCANVISTVSVTSTASNYDSYIWTPATNLYTDAGATIPYAGGSATLLYYKSAVANTITYTLNATNSVSGCANLVTTTRSTDLPTVSAVANPTMLCSGSTATLVASSVSSGTSAVGTSSTTTSTQGITPYGSNWEGSRQQYLIRASELQAANIYPGNLTSLSFSVTALGGGAFPQSNFTIKMAHTANTTLSSAYGTPAGGFTTVYGPATQALPTLGLNLYTFSTPFNWDGVSNILVDVCHDNDPSSTCIDCYSSNSTVTYNTTSYSSVWGSYEDDAQSCGVQAGNTISTYNNRPNIIFGGQVLNAAGAGLNWVWNPGAINTNTAVVTPVNTGTNAAVSDYTVTGTNAATTCSNSAVVSITVNPVPATPATVNSVQCGLGIPTASVSGGTSYNWYATPTSTTIIQSGASATYTATINSTTDFYVSVFNGNCESARAVLTASVTSPDAITAASTATAICPGQSFTLSATNTGTNNVYTYTWTASPATGSGIATSVTGATASVMPTVTGTYNYIVTGADAACTTTAAVSVALNAPPVIAASASPSVICSGATATLNALANAVSSGTAIVGTQSSVNYIGGPYRGGSAADDKAQWLFTAAELNAAGIFAGNITSISFNNTTAGSVALPNFTIRMGTTNTTSLSNVYDAAPPIVVGPITYTAVNGVNTHTFAPFFWNGTSNIVIEACHDNTNILSMNVDMATISNRTLYSSVAGACSQTSGTLVTYRPVIRFGAQVGSQSAAGLNWQWNPGAINSNSTTVSPVTTGANSYTVTATDPATTCSNTAVVTLTVNPVPSVTVAASTGSVCSGTTASLTATGATTYSWMPAGGTSSVAVVNPAATTVYTVTGTSAGCSNSQTVSLTVNPSPTVAASASPSVICAGATVSLTANGATTYSWMPNGSASGTTTATPSVSTTYTVTGTTAGCTNTRTLTVTVNDVPTLTVTSNPANAVLCSSGASATLTASGTSTAYVWSSGSTSSTTTVSPSGTTSYTVSGTNSCGTKTTVATVSVGVTPTITATSASSLICANSPVVLTANATAGASYSWNTGASTMSISVSPSVTTTYTVNATNLCGTATATVVQNVSPCTGIEVIVNSGEIHIYPNPASDVVNIALPAGLSLSNTSVEVSDALGKLVMKESIQADVTTLKISKLEDGVYFFKVISNNQTLKIGKVVKH